MSAPIDVSRLPPIVDAARGLGTLAAGMEANDLLAADTQLGLLVLAQFVGHVDGEATPTLRATPEECIAQWRRVVARVRGDVERSEPARLRTPRLAVLDAASDLFVRALRVREGA